MLGYASSCSVISSPQMTAQNVAFQEQGSHQQEVKFQDQIFRKFQDTMSQEKTLLDTQRQQHKRSHDL